MTSIVTIMETDDIVIYITCLCILNSFISCGIVVSRMQWWADADDDATRDRSLMECWKIGVDGCSRYKPHSVFEMWEGMVHEKGVRGRKGVYRRDLGVVYRRAVLDSVYNFGVEGLEDCVFSSDLLLVGDGSVEGCITMPTFKHKINEKFEIISLDRLSVALVVAIKCKTHSTQHSPIHFSILSLVWEHLCMVVKAIMMLRFFCEFIKSV